MSQRNMLSALGRMSYGAHLLFYPGAALLYFAVVKPVMDSRAKQAEKKEWEDMFQARPVDPDYFSPFTSIPYHNNPELKYVFAHVRMHNYVNENQINVKDYPWKNYHDSYDHGDNKTYLYNWRSMVSKNH